MWRISKSKSNERINYNAKGGGGLRCIYKGQAVTSCYTLFSLKLHRKHLGRFIVAACRNSTYHLWFRIWRAYRWPTYRKVAKIFGLWTGRSPGNGGLSTSETTTTTLVQMPTITLISCFWWMNITSWSMSHPKKHRNIASHQNQVSKWRRKW